jgi:aryl-alcohol dehydrogenase-like predicted oxidoreductase
MVFGSGARDSKENTAMPSRRLGTTAFTVSRIGLGLAALGRPAYINLGRGRDLGGDRSVPRLEARCHDMLDAAWAAGIRYFDGARSYGMAEDFLASWLSRRNPPADAITIGSKWGYTYVGSWRMDATVHEVKDLSAANLRRQIRESRQRLGAGLRVYQIHSATVESGVLDDRDVLGELARLRDEGLAIGLSVSGAQQSDAIRHALRVRVDGVNPFQVVQATWNLLEPSAGAALADANASGWGVIVKEAVANGRLTSHAGGEHPAELDRQAAAHGATIDAIAIAAALSQPWADVVLSGAVTREQLAANLRAIDVAERGCEWPAIAEAPDEYWTRRRSLAWT